MIEIKGVSKHFKNETAIDYRDLEFIDGKSYMLLGASGCGKSTLLNMIAGILSPEKGSIIINGENIVLRSQQEKDKFRINKIGYIFQDFKLINEMTVNDNINILNLEKINTKNIKSTDFKGGLSKKYDLYNEGYKSVKNYIKTHE